MNMTRVMARSAIAIVLSAGLACSAMAQSSKSSQQRSDGDVRSQDRSGSTMRSGQRGTERDQDQISTFDRRSYDEGYRRGWDEGRYSSTRNFSAYGDNRSNKWTNDDSYDSWNYGDFDRSGTYRNPPYGASSDRWNGPYRGYSNRPYYRNNYNSYSDNSGRPYDWRYDSYPYGYGYDYSDNYGWNDQYDYRNNYSS